MILCLQAAAAAAAAEAEKGKEKAAAAAAAAEEEKAEERRAVAAAMQMQMQPSAAAPAYAQSGSSSAQQGIEMMGQTTSPQLQTSSDFWESGGESRAPRAAEPSVMVSGRLGFAEFVNGKYECQPGVLYDDLPTYRRT